MFETSNFYIEVLKDDCAEKDEEGWYTIPPVNDHH